MPLLFSVFNIAWSIPKVMVKRDAFAGLIFLQPAVILRTTQASPGSFRPARWCAKVIAEMVVAMVADAYSFWESEAINNTSVCSATGKARLILYSTRKARNVCQARW